MEMSKEMQDAMNNQIELELNSAYLYLSFSVWFGKKEFKNLEKLFYEKAKEEFEHFRKISEHIQFMGGNVILPAITKPKSDWTGIKEIVESTYGHEKLVTSKIHELVTLADEKSEYASKPLLDWFVEEQIEEEVTSRHMVKMYEGFKNDWLFDHRVRTKE